MHPEKSSDIGKSTGELTAMALAMRQRAQCKKNNSPASSTLPHNKKQPELLPAALGPEKCCTPNQFLRSAIFAAIQGKDRRCLRRELVGSLENVQIRFTGWQLDQSDLDVWQAILGLAREQKTFEVKFSAHAILKILGRGTGKSQHEWLKHSMSRLYSAGIELTGQGVSPFGALLKGVRNEITKQYVVVVDADFARVFGGGWTAVDVEKRRQLRGKPLAQWLFGWVSSHARPFPIKVETLAKLSGSKNSQLASFSRQLHLAVAELKKIGVILFGEISGGVLKVECVPSDSQKSHLRKRAT